MISVKCILLAFFAVIISVNAFKLPNSITKCKLSDPKLNDCLTKQSNIFWQHLIKEKGDISLGIPPLKTVNLPDVNLNKPIDFKFTLKNVLGSGFALMKINKLKVDFEKNKFSLTTFTPQSDWEGNYTVDGILQNQTFKDEGYLVSTYINSNIAFTAELKTTIVDNAEYLSVENGLFDFEPEKILFKLSHPDGTDDAEAQKLSHIMNEKYDNFGKYYMEVVKGIGNILFSTFANNILKLSPKIELFDP